MRGWQAQLKRGAHVGCDKARGPASAVRPWLTDLQYDLARTGSGTEPGNMPFVLARPSILLATSDCDGRSRRLYRGCVQCYIVWCDGPLPGYMCRRCLTQRGRLGGCADACVERGKSSDTSTASSIAVTFDSS